MLARLRPWATVYGWALALAAILLWPVSGSGYLLARDMVFTPHQPLDLAAVGASSAAPRAVPVDALVALAEQVVDGAVIARFAVLLPVVLAGVGAARLLRSASTAARLATCGFAIWNPYVIERLALGQWALLWGYAALPWLLDGIAHARPGRWAGRALALAAASITPTGGLVAAVTAVVTVTGLRRGRREIAATVGLAFAMQLPWLVPALISTASRTSDPAGVSAFAARAEHGGGALLTLLGGGGIWDADVVPGSRAGALPWVGIAVLGGAAVIGTRCLAELAGARLVRCVAALAAVGLFLALFADLPGGHAVLTGLMRHVPGAGLLRDGQKFVMPLVLLAALLAGAAVEVAVRRWRSAPAIGLLLVGSLAVPLVLLPDGAATLRPALRPVHYPAEWSAARSLVRGGDALSLPLGSYRSFPWAPGRTVYDPASRLLRVPTVIDDRLAVSGHLIAGEDRLAERVVAAVQAGPEAATRLAALGIRWVVVEHRTPGPVPVLMGLPLVRDGADVSIYRVPAAVAPARAAPARVAAILAADVIALLVLAVLVGAQALRRPRPAVRRAEEGT
jgi:hypothetical protein